MDCDAFSDEEKVELEVTDTEAIFPLSLATLCLMKRLGRSALGYMVGKIEGGCLHESALTTWCSSFLENLRAILFALKNA